MTAFLWLVSWPVGPFLLVYIIGEVLFFFLYYGVFLPRCNRPVEPEYLCNHRQDRHQLMLRIMKRLERVCKKADKPFIPAYSSFLHEWFHKESEVEGQNKAFGELPCKGDVDQFFSWAFFGMDHDRLEPSMCKDLESMYSSLSELYGINFEPGKTPGVRPMRLSLDHVDPSYRPLLIYLFFGCVRLVAKFFLMGTGFQFHKTKSGIRYWYRPQIPMLNVSGQDEPILPTLFFHGIAPGGLACYLPMLLCGLGRDGRALFLFENPAITFNICFRSPTEEETVLGVWEAVQSHLKPDVGLSVIGHSFGSCQITWLLHSKKAHRIRQITLLDPVSILLSEPDVMTNFLYKRNAHKVKGTRNRIGVVANELFIEHYLRRQFAWYNSELWLDDIPSHCKTVICLSENDEILNAKKVKLELDIHLDDIGGSMNGGLRPRSDFEVLVWEGGRHAHCVTRPDRWRQTLHTIQRQEQLILQEEQVKN